MNVSISFFESVRFRNGRSAGASPNDSRRERSTSASTITRPAVVSTISPLLRRYSIGCWSPIWRDSTAISISSSDWKRFGLGSRSSDLCSFRSMSE